MTNAPLAIAVAVANWSKSRRKADGGRTRARLDKHKPDDTVKLIVLRAENKATVTLTIKLAALTSPGLI